MVFAGTRNVELAEGIADHLGVELGSAKITTFANGEIYVRYLESVRGADVFIVQSMCTPVNHSLMELLIMIDAAKRASARTITAVDPVAFKREKALEFGATHVAGEVFLPFVSGGGASPANDGAGYDVQVGLTGNEPTTAVVNPLNPHNVAVARGGNLAANEKVKNVYSVERGKGG